MFALLNVLSPVARRMVAPLPPTRVAADPPWRGATDPACVERVAAERDTSSERALVTLL